jgi:hypothetical protein
MVVISGEIYCPLFGIKGSTSLLITTYGIHGDAERETVCINKNHVVKEKSLCVR